MRAHKLSKRCWCKPKVLSFKGDKVISAILMSFIHVLKEKESAGKVNTVFLEREAKKLIRKLGQEEGK